MSLGNKEKSETILPFLILMTVSLSFIWTHNWNSPSKRLLKFLCLLIWFPLGIYLSTQVKVLNKWWQNMVNEIQSHRPVLLMKQMLISEYYNLTKSFKIKQKTEKQLIYKLPLKEWYETKKINKFWNMYIRKIILLNI